MSSWTYLAWKGQIRLREMYQVGPISYQKVQSSPVQHAKLGLFRIDRRNWPRHGCRLERFGINLSDPVH